VRRLAFALSALLLALLAAAPASARPHDNAPPPSEAAGETTAAAPEAALTGVRSVATGYYHSCAILTNRQVRCWGYNTYGQLGDGSEDNSTTPVIVRNASDTGPLQNVVQLALGDYHSCALLTNKQVRCWGYGSYGALGGGDFDNSSLPITVRNAGDTGPLLNVVQIGGESDGTCAILTNRQVRCWGEDDYGQLGNGLPESNSNLPVAVKGVGGNGVLTGIASLGAGYDNNCAATQSGQGRCWGYVGDGALGNGTDDDDSPVPVVVRNAQNGQPLTGIRQLAQGGYHGCALLTNSQVRCWGDNNDGQLGTGGTNDNTRAVLVKLPNGNPLTGVVTVKAGTYSTCALLNTGRVRCWGEDDYGENGDGTIESPEFRKFPNFVHGTGNSGILTGVTQLSGESYHYCVRLNNGQARCWGYDSYGALGNGGSSTTPYPVRVQV
jgi:alpha-tubulin suppressor-like RCC1 family protein